MLTTIYILVIVTPVPQTCFCNDWTEESFSYRAEAFMFSGHYTNSILQQHNLNQRCYSNPAVDESLNSERSFGQSLSTFNQNHCSKDFCSEAI